MTPETMFSLKHCCTENMCISALFVGFFFSFVRFFIGFSENEDPVWAFWNLRNPFSEFTQKLMQIHTFFPAGCWRECVISATCYKEIFKAEFNLEEVKQGNKIVVCKR